MGNVINLRQARKQKARAEKRSISDLRSAVTGVTKSERTRAKHLKDRKDHVLDGHQRDDKAE